MANIVNGTSTGSGGLITTGDSSDELQLQTAETARVTLTNTAVVVNEDGNDVDFRVEGDTEANLLFVDASTDRVGIGTNTPANTLDINGQITASSGFNSGDALLGNGTLISGGATSDCGIRGGGNILFAPSSTAERARITSDGYLRMASGSSGIQFNGDTAAANALDDYEEGTWTPSVGGTATYTVQEGAYTKIGNTVFVRGKMVIASIGTGTTNYFEGLPFSAGEECSIPVNKLADSSFSFYFATLRTSGTSLYISGQTALDGTIAVNQVFLQNSTEVQFSGVYYV